MKTDERTVIVVRSTSYLREDDAVVLKGTLGIVVGFVECGDPFGAGVDVIWEGYVFSGEGMLDTYHGMRVNALFRAVEVVEVGRLIDVSVTQEIKQEARAVATRKIE